jgi:hypothetical protein
VRQSYDKIKPLAYFSGRSSIRRDGGGQWRLQSFIKGFDEAIDKGAGYCMGWGPGFATH